MLKVNIYHLNLIIIEANLHIKLMQIRIIIINLFYLINYFK